MDFYKKIFPNREMRFKILKILDFIPDKIMIQVQYFIKTGRWPNIEYPQRYSEKIQWYKLYYHDPLIKVCSDKYTVRKYVERKNLGSILNTLFGVYERAEDIDFDNLPNSFVMKLTTGGGSTSVRFVYDKDNIEIDTLRKLANKWLTTYSGTLGREWGYKNIQPKVIFEKILPKNVDNDLMDYKFYCFNGQPFCFYVIDDANPEIGRCSLYDMDFRPLPFRRKEFAPLLKNPDKPSCFEKMVDCAKILSKDFPHVRVDLYNVRGAVYFGELTFYTGSGYGLFEPDKFDKILGNQFKLPKKLL